MEVEEVDLRRVDDPKDPDAWEKEIGKAGIGGAYVFSDASLRERERRRRSVNSRLKGGGGRWNVGSGM